jgi:molybdate transport system ATP-binding protein
MSIEIRFRFGLENFQLDVNLDLPGRGVTSLFGPSGCGKTSLLRAIAGLDRHPGGFLRVGDLLWQDGETFLPPHRRPVGYVFQEASLFEHLTVQGNLEYGLKRVPEADRSISLERAIGLLGIGPLLPRSPITLSGGERQRVAIARALAVSPRLLLMDEPLAAVDLERRQEILPWIEVLHRELDIPVIHVSHAPEEVARLADHLVLMRAGQVTAAGDMHQIFTRLDLPLALDPDATSVIEATVIGHDEEYRLTRLEFAGGQFTVARQPIATGSPVRLRLAARDVSLTLQRQTGTSILNILPVTVDELSLDDEAQVTVLVLARSVPILARITRKSATELGLQPGMQIFAQAKSIALLHSSGPGTGQREQEA